ncbi:MNIO family bufferin maturase [Vibrio salinus]|uniref:MNIO family bufferin maturase n=1 Tax=Vibrio salinus TaxID=2899784 RepID=UPI001E3081E5|nr:DUF692 domain-containing protein [Vibrio salinus]MCE0493386.1 DUF692 domain-containing protein [Vibrio salinus]
MLSSISKGTDVPLHFPDNTGVSLKPCYYQHILDESPDVGFFEIHAENYLSAGGPAKYYLDKIREDYPLTIHGVGLSIGGEQPLNLDHLQKVTELVNRIDPIVFSEHLAWSSHFDHYFNDLLPLPYTKTTLNRVCSHIDQIQSVLQRTILLENPSTYIEFEQNDYSEVEFLNQIAKQTGCRLLLDVNNVEVSCFNHGCSARDYLAQFPLGYVEQIHLAGYTLDENENIPLKIDSHNAPVSSEVWELYRQVQSGSRLIPTLIEWDSNLPVFDQLQDQAQEADRIMTLLRNSYADTASANATYSI